MLGNATSGLLLLESPKWNSGEYHPWSNITVSGGEYDRGSEGVCSIEVTPNTARYTPGAQPMIDGLDILDVDMRNGGVVVRYVKGMKFRYKRSASRDEVRLALSILCDTVCIVCGGYPRDRVWADQGATAVFM